jgi:hypothetical protein
VLAQVEGVVLDLVQVLKQVVEAEARVGDEIVEATHQLRLGEHGDVGERHRAGGRQALAPKGGARDGVAGQPLDALLLEALEPFARPALTLDQLLALSNAARHVLQARRPIAHRVLLRP